MPGVELLELQNFDIRGASDYGNPMSKVEELRARRERVEAARRRLRTPGVPVTMADLHDAYVDDPDYKGPVAGPVVEGRVVKRGRPNGTCPRLPLTLKVTTEEREVLKEKAGERPLSVWAREVLLAWEEK